jgi:hypothetical protein
MSLKVAAECWPASIGIRALQRRFTQLRNAAQLWHNCSGLRGSGLRAREGARRTRQKADPARRRSGPRVHSVAGAPAVPRLLPNGSMPDAGGIPRVCSTINRPVRARRRID